MIFSACNFHILDYGELQNVKCYENTWSHQETDKNLGLRVKVFSVYMFRVLLVLGLRDLSEAI